MEHEQLIQHHPQQGHEFAYDDWLSECVADPRSIHGDVGREEVVGLGEGRRLGAEREARDDGEDVLGAGQRGQPRREAREEDASFLLAPVAVGGGENEALEEAESERGGFSGGVGADEESDEPRRKALHEGGEQRAHQGGAVSTIIVSFEEILLERGRRDVGVVGELLEGLDEGAEGDVAERLQVAADGHDGEEPRLERGLVAVVRNGEHDEGEHTRDGEIEPVAAAPKGAAHDLAAADHGALRQAVPSDAVREVQHQLRAIQAIGVEVAVGILLGEQLEERASDFFADEFRLVCGDVPLKKALLDEGDVADCGVFVRWRMLIGARLVRRQMSGATNRRWRRSRCVIISKDVPTIVEVVVCENVAVEIHRGIHHVISGNTAVSDL